MTRWQGSMPCWCRLRRRFAAWPRWPWSPCATTRSSATTPTSPTWRTCVPCGITVLAPAWHDTALAHLGKRWQAGLGLPLGATARALPAPAAPAPAPGSVRLAVVGAHLSGMPLNFQLTTRNAVLVEQTLTGDSYRLYALPGTVPPKPGLAKADSGRSIIIELWDMPIARFGEFVAEIPAPLGIGNLSLADGRSV